MSSLCSGGGSGGAVCTGRKKKRSGNGESRRIKRELVELVDTPVADWDPLVCELCGAPASRILHDDVAETRRIVCNCGHTTELRELPWDDDIDVALNDIIWPELVDGEV